ncbi:uncharacterized protein LOC121861128 [Homarus americanus]|uniref:uncharacterized protein LOC121861128 n=1 Tax=Homarus americanus TaxID=6706 RepID=UPI001C454A1D|nr:uncharacterized protein LOC121861128 [Homarus americanus]
MNRAIFLPLLLLALADCSVSLRSDNMCPQEVAAPCHQLTGNTPVGCYDITYTEPNMTVLGAGRGNPERGFYTYTETSTSNWNPLNVADLQSFVQQGYTLIFRYVILDTFVNSNISDDILLKIGEDFDTLREAGMKVLLRLCYSISESIKSDAKLNQLLSHLNQLTPILDEHAGVIAVVQAGFIGVWGEWYYTENYGDEGVISQANWMDRGTVLSQLMNAIPASRHIQLRTPKYKKVLLNRTSPITKNEAYYDTMVARLGIHNDCFLASDTDYGTYENIAVDYPFLQEETKYLPMGGETCNYNPPRSDCPTALKELRELHFTYLNNGYHEGVLNSWKTQSCYNEVQFSYGKLLCIPHALSLRLLPVAHPQRTDAVPCQLLHPQAAVVSLKVSFHIRESTAPDADKTLEDFPRIKSLNYRPRRTARGLLELRNTPNFTGRSPAPGSIRHHLRSCVPAHPKFFESGRPRLRNVTAGSRIQPQMSLLGYDCRAVSALPS